MQNNKKRGNADKENVPPPKRARAQPAKKVKGTYTVVYRESTPSCLSTVMSFYYTSTNMDNALVVYVFRC